MVGSIPRILLGLTVLLTATVLSRSYASAQAGSTVERTGSNAAAAKAERASQYTLPGEEPPQAFVPLHPQTVVQRQEIEAVTDFCAARAFEFENLWTDAIDLLEKALTKEPDSAAILKRLSGLCYALGKIEPFLKYGKRVLEIDPGDMETISLLVAYYGKNDPAETETLLKGILSNPALDKGGPGYLLVQLELGRFYFDKLRQVDRAADALAKVVDALDEKAANRLSPADQKRILGGDESAAAASYLDFGLVFLAAKRYDLAVKAFRRGLVYDEEDPQLPRLLAEALLKDGQSDAALKQVEEFLKRQPQGSEGYELLAQVLTALGRQNEITTRLEAAADADSKNILLKYMLADRYREVGQVDRAERMYKALLAAQPTTQGYGALAASLFKRKKTEELLKVMTEAITKPGGVEAIAPQLEAIARDPAYADEVLDTGLKMLSATPPMLESKYALSILTHIATHAEKPEKLVALERLMLKQNPNPLVYKGIAEALLQLRKYAEAATTLDELIAKYPDEKDARLLVSLANCRRAAEQYEAALVAIREALKLDPADTSAQTLLIMILSQLGKVDEAVQAARNVLKDDPSNPDFNRLLGYILTQFGRTNEAIDFYKNLLEHYPNNREVVRLARSGLSVAYVNINEYAKGEAELEILLEQDPDEAGVNNDLGYLYADQGKNLEKAEAMIRKAVQEEPDRSAYLDSLGWVLFKRGRLKDAVEPLEKAVQNLAEGGDATIYEHLGDVYFQLQETQKARSAWEQAEKAAAKAVPTDRRLPEIRKKLRSLEKLGSTPKPDGNGSP
jgi:tetratricopeptide (TPR) repeat protein